jgi:hypothetical protein
MRGTYIVKDEARETKAGYRKTRKEKLLKQQRNLEGENNRVTEKLT